MATNTAPSFTEHTAPSSGSTAGPYSISFSYIDEDEVDVTVNGVLKDKTTHYTFASATTIEFTNAGTPPNSAAIKFQRDTNIGSKKVDFQDGSVLTETDLDSSTDQLLFGLQELSDDYVKRDGSQTITGNLVFEGSTDDNNETTLAITDPTADRTITIPDRSGTVVTTGDSGTVTSTMISDGTILNVDVNANAAIQGTKISPNFGSQNIVANGTANFNSTNVTGTLGVSNGINLTGTLAVTGAGDFTNLIHGDGGAHINNIRIGVTGDNEIDTSSGNLTIDSAGGTTTIDDNLIVSGTTTLQGNLGVNAAIVGFGTLGITGTATIPDITGGAVVTSGTSTSDTKVYSAKRAGEIFYGKGTVEEIQSGETWSSADDKVATTAAIDARIIDLVDDVGGFVPIANETSFPSTNPDINTSNANKGGTIVSVKAASTNLTAQSGTTLTIANGRGTGNAVIITGVSATIPSGFGFLVETTATDHTYAFHRLVPKATEVTTVALNATQVQTVHNNITQVQTVHNNISDIQAVAADASDIGAVAAKATEIGLLGNADVITDMSILGTADVVADLAILGTTDVVADMNALAVADVISDMNTLAVTSVINNMDTVATNVTNVNNVGGSISNVNAVASNLSSVNSFANTYRIGANNPTTSLDTGDLFFNTTSNSLKVYTGSAWVDGVTATGNFAVVTGNTFTGSNVHNDNVKSLYGTGSDFEIFYNGTNTQLAHTANTGAILLQAAPSESSIRCNASDSVELYYDNNKKLETHANGVNISGRLLLGDSSGANDNRIRLGADGDLSIFHDGTQSYIANATGNLDIRTNTASIDLQSNNGSENMAKFIPNGAVELYHNNSRKFHTRNDGVNIIGDLDMTDADGYKINLGANSDLQIYHDGSNSIIEDNGTGGLILGVSGTGTSGFYKGTGAEALATFEPDGPVTLYHNNSSKLVTTSSGVTVSGNVDTDGIRMGDNDEIRLGTGDDLKIYHDGTNNLILGSPTVLIKNKANSESYIRCTENAQVELYYDNSKKFHTNAGGCQIFGNLFNGDSTHHYFGDSNDLDIHHDGNSHIANGTGEFRLRSNDLRLMNAAGNEHYFVGFANSYSALYFDNSKKLETTSSGVTLTGDLNVSNDVLITGTGEFYGFDNAKLVLGHGRDLQIFHDGTDSYIDNNTGNLNIICDSTQAINLKHGSENMLRAITDGAVELYYDNSKKLETLSTGIDVTGSCGCDSLNVNSSLGNNGALVVKLASNKHIGFNPNQGEVGNVPAIVAFQDNGSLQSMGFRGVDLRFATGSAQRWSIDSSGHFVPAANNSYDIGTTSNRVRNVYTNDLNLSNEGSKNDVDGTWGSYTIQEGAESLFLINKRNGKKYMFNLTEVS